MYLIFHSTAQREIALYQVWGSDISELKWVLPFDNLVCSSEVPDSLLPCLDWSKKQLLVCVQKYWEKNTAHVEKPEAILSS